MEKENSLGRVFSVGHKLFSSIAQSSAYLSIAGDLGHPAALRQLIKTRPGLRAEIKNPSPSVSLDNEAMRHYRADYYYANLPQPYTDLQAIFLPRQKERSVKVAEILRAEGFFNLGRYLQDLCFKGASTRFII